MFVLLGGGILLAAFILSTECIQRIREKRKVAAQFEIKRHSKKMIRSYSLTVKDNITIEPFRPLTALTTY